LLASGGAVSVGSGAVPNMVVAPDSSEGPAPSVQPHTPVE